MKKVMKMAVVSLAVMVCSIAAAPAAVSAATVSNLLVDGGQYTLGRYSLDLDLTSPGKTEYVEFKVVNGDGDEDSMVSMVMITMGKGKEKIQVIAPDQFSQRSVSTVIGTLGEEVVRDLRSLKVDIRVGGPPGRGIRLYVTEYYDSAVNWPPRPTGW